MTVMATALMASAPITQDGDTVPAMSAGARWTSPGSDEDDVELVRAIAAGDRNGLAALYDRYAPILLGMAMRIIRDRREAEDLLHDVFLEVWRSARDYDLTRGRVRTWLVVRMRSRALDVLKSARVSRRGGDPETLERMVAEPEAGESPDRQRVRSVLAELTGEQRQVLELAYFDGLSCSEIATQLAIPIGTVKSRLAAGLSRLRQLLGASPRRTGEVQS
ncbi:MAG TPA: sigma-70 family RNA polymerase sigma factor [Kofleriaceae bacterium]|nr:sigma-70 family RNA polymerase sigma factor [Kofleriaceae bacterium]